MKPKAALESIEWAMRTGLSRLKARLSALDARRRALLAVTAVATVLCILFFVVAPASSGCGSRRVVGDSTPATASAPTPAAPAPAQDAAPPPVAEPPVQVAIPAPAKPELAGAAALPGDYDCKVTRGDREFRPAACAIRAGADGALRFEQTAGTVRVNGTVAADEAGFRLTGEITCTSGPCLKGSRELVFFSQGNGAYSAVVPMRSGLLLNIDLTRRPGAAQSAPIVQ
jgi:hypothetical protein